MQKIERFSPNIKKGLNEEQIQQRINNNLVNYNTESSTKSVKEIV